VRTYHPALRAHRAVYVCESNFGPPVWVVRGNAPGVEAGGRDIHPYPVDHENLLHFGTTLIPGSQWKADYLFPTAINPRKLLTPAQLDGLRELFPNSIGARVLITGFLVILLPSLSDIEKAHGYDWVMVVGGLRTIYDVLVTEATADTVTSGMEVADSPNSINGNTVTSGMEVSDSPNSINGTGCLGIKLCMTNGTEAITTVTHGFVKKPCPFRFTRIFHHLISNLKAVKAAIRRFRRPPQPCEVPAVGTSRGSLSNSPIGKVVWLAAENRRVSTSRLLPFFSFTY
jgi:hypothetical protein